MTKINKSTILAAIMAALTACTEKTDETILFDTLTADKEVKLSNDEGSPGCAIHLQMLYATDDNGHKAEIVNNIIEKQLLNMEELSMKHAVDSFANNYVATYLRDLLPLYNQDRADTAKRSWYDYHYIITTEARPCQLGTTAYIAIIDYYEGGSHNYDLQQTINFETKTGRQLTLEDIFVAGYENQLSSVLQAALYDKLGVYELSDLHEKGYLHNIDMFPSKNFVLDNETITFIYNPSEIAPYDEGSIELTVPLATLKRILKPEYII